MDGCLSTNCTGCPERFLCHCLQVTEDTVMEALAELQIRSLKDLRQHTGAGSGCTACHHKLRRYIERYAQSSSSAEPICSVK
jgi:bacterioferritin-associated ferredoxin